MSLCSTQEDQYPTSLKDLISHICQRVSDSSDVDPESIIDLTNCVKSIPSSESCDQNICDCLICPYEFSVCFVALSVLKVLINNLDVMLFLNNKFKFQVYLRYYLYNSVCALIAFFSIYYIFRIVYYKPNFLM